MRAYVSINRNRKWT